MKTFTTITNAIYYHTLREDAEIGETIWSINKNAKVGDCVLLYVCAPISAIVATAYISDVVYLDEDINSMWFNTWFAPMGDLQMLDVSVSRHQLREIFPTWRYWLQPRNSIEVQSEYLPKLEKMLAQEVFEMNLFDTMRNWFEVIMENYNFEEMSYRQLVNLSLILTKTVKMLRAQKINNVRFWQVINARQKVLNLLAGV